MKIRNNTPASNDIEGTIKFKLEILHDWIERYVCVYDAANHGKFVGYNKRSDIDVITDFVIKLVEKDLLGEYLEFRKGKPRGVNTLAFCRNYAMRHSMKTETVRTRLKKC